MRSVLRNPALLATALGHTGVDLFSNALPVLLVVFAARLGLSNVGIGTVVLVYTFLASLTQPLFGLVADRWRTRWLGVGALLWSAGCFALAAVLPGSWALVAFVVSGLGAGAYHPHGSLNARQASGKHVGSGTSLFFFFGICGQAAGPLLSGTLLDYVSLSTTILLLAGMVALIALTLARFGPRFTNKSAPASDGGQQGVVSPRWSPVAIAGLILLIFFWSWPMAASNTFLPKWLADEGFSSLSFGALLSAFTFACAAGNILGGWLADRWTRKGTMVLAMSLATLPFYALYLTPSTGLGATIAAALAGLLLGVPHSLLVLMGQNLLPQRMGFASGLVLGLSFCSNALAAWLTGWLGDLVGLQQALQLIPWICGIAALCALTLPRTRPGREFEALPVGGD